MNEGRSMVVKSPPEIMGTRIIDLLDGDFIQFLQTLDCPQVGKFDVFITVENYKVNSKLYK
jgi:hypothetical protein